MSAPPPSLSMKKNSYVKDDFKLTFSNMYNLKAELKDL